jgi:hypothetical protein
MRRFLNKRRTVMRLLYFLPAAELLMLPVTGSAFAQRVISSSNKLPYFITKAGSYKLGSDLTPPLNTDAIDVKVNNVTIDLNGFSITGSSPTTSGIWAISATSSSGVVVKNGIVSGLCLSLGQNALVEDIVAFSCFVTDAIDVGSNSIVLRSQALKDHDQGILCGEGPPSAGIPANNCLFADDTATANGQSGIVCLGNGCNLTRNTANDNGANGLGCNGTGCLFNDDVGNSNVLSGIATLDHTSALNGNVLNGNGTVPFGGATSLGNNLCNGSPC